MSPLPASTVTVTALGSGGATVTEKAAASGGETVTQTVTESAAGGGNSSEPVPTTAASDQPIGGKIGTALPLKWSDAATDKISTGTITVSSAKKAAVLGTDPDFQDKPKNGVILIVDVTYSATTGTVDYNPYNWKVKDADGREYDSSFASQANLTELQSGKLPAGEKVRGVIIFDVPKGGLKLNYTIGFSGVGASWPIPA